MAPTALPAHSSKAPPADALRILVVEDDLTDQGRIERTLTDAGFAVDLAANGADALAMYRAGNYAAVTLDLLLPDMNGLQVLEALRQDPDDQTVPVVVITVVTDRATGGFAVHDVLPKPLDESALLVSLRRAGVQAFPDATIMVVDDDLMSLKLVSTMLAPLGYRTTCYQDSRTALRALDGLRPAAIILDLLMPHVDGIQFLARVREMPAHRDLPVLVWTMKDLSGTELEELSASAVAVLDKSAEALELSQALRSCIGRHRAYPSVT